jgi:hypothetical protein
VLVWASTSVHHEEDRSRSRAAVRAARAPSRADRADVAVDPGRASPLDAAELQRLVGNRAVANALAQTGRIAPGPAVVQRVVPALPTATVANSAAVLALEKIYGARTTKLAGWDKSKKDDHWIAGHADRNFTPKERADVNARGNRYGCADFNCSNTVPGTATGNWIPDHEPFNCLDGAGYAGAFRFYPHCKDCSNDQAGMVGAYKAEMKRQRPGTDDSDWATGIDGRWFWL